MGNIFSRLFVGVLVALFVTAPIAQTMETTAPVVQYQRTSNGALYSTPAALCAASVHNGVWADATVPSSGAIWCYSSTYNQNYNLGTRINTCPDSTWSLISGLCRREACPAGTERDASGVCQAACPVGWEKDAQGVCRKDCTGKLGQSPLDTHFATLTHGSFNFNDCDVKCNKRVEIGGTPAPGDHVQIVTGYIQSECSYTGKPGTGDVLHGGESFTPTPDDTPDNPRDCLGKGDGYIQSSTGAVTCVPSASAPAGQKPVTVTKTGESSTETKDATGNVTSSSTTQKTTSTAPDGTATATETTINKNADGTATKSVTSTTVGKNGEVIKETKLFDVAADGTETERGTEKQTSKVDDYCRTNPGAEVCKGKDDSTFGGSCEAGFTCTGDAATCAVAQAAHSMKCQGETRGALNDLGDKVMDGSDGKGVDTIENEIINLSAGVSTGSGSGGSCPPLPQIMGKTIDIGEACSILQGLGNAGVALSLLMAGFIVVGGIRGL